MNRTIAIGLGTGAVGVLAVILLDDVTHGVTHTVLTAVVILLLLAAAVLLHHVAHQMELSMRLQIRGTEEESSRSSHDPNRRSS